VISVITYTIDFAIFGRRLRNCGTIHRHCRSPEAMMRNSNGETPKLIFVWKLDSENTYYQQYKYSRCFKTLYIYCYLFYFKTFTAEIYSFFFLDALSHTQLARDVIPVQSDRGYFIIPTRTPQMCQQKHVPWLLYDIYTGLIQCQTHFITQTSPELYWGHKSWHVFEL